MSESLGWIFWCLHSKPCVYTLISCVLLSHSWVPLLHWGVVQLCRCSCCSPLPMKPPVILFPTGSPLELEHLGSSACSSYHYTCVPSQIWMPSLNHQHLISTTTDHLITTSTITTYNTTLYHHHRLYITMQYKLLEYQCIITLVAEGITPLLHTAFYSMLW